MLYSTRKQILLMLLGLFFVGGCKGRDSSSNVSTDVSFSKLQKWDEQTVSPGEYEYSSHDFDADKLGGYFQLDIGGDGLVEVHINSYASDRFEDHDGDGVLDYPAVTYAKKEGSRWIRKKFAWTGLDTDGSYGKLSLGPAKKGDSFRFIFQQPEDAKGDFIRLKSKAYALNDNFEVVVDYEQHSFIDIDGNNTVKVEVEELDSASKLHWQFSSRIYTKTQKKQSILYSLKAGSGFKGDRVVRVNFSTYPVFNSSTCGYKVQILFQYRPDPAAKWKTTSRGVDGTCIRTNVDTVFLYREKGEYRFLQKIESKTSDPIPTLGVILSALKIPKNRST